MSNAIHWARHRFHSVIALPENYEIYDFSQAYDPDRPRSSEYGVGKYNEKRRGMYNTDLFSGRRDIHVGIDLAGPVGTPVHAFYEGEVFLFGYNGAEGDYGYTLITHHVLDGADLYALHGHLSATSVEGKREGQRFRAGDVIAWLGDRHENGGWNPHLHFQLSLLRPEKPDLPGAVSDEDLEEALRLYPDPRLVLGPLY